MLDALNQGGHVAVVKPWPVNSAVPGGFTVDDVVVEEVAGTLTCPNGVTRPVNRGRHVNFGAASRGCPLREQCTRSRTGKSMRLREHDALARAQRVRAADPEFQAVDRQHRPMVERSTVRLVAGGNRKLRYRGTVTNNVWLHHRTAALNLRRMLILGLTATPHRWALT